MITTLNGFFENECIDVLRLDAEGIIAGGNKFYKLKYNLLNARALGCDTLVTMGGAFSNHIAATALAGKTENFKTIGIIRGERPSLLSTTLEQAERNGMHLIFVSRELYRKYREEQEMISAFFPKAYFLPEGGSNALAVKGCMEILDDSCKKYDLIAVATGTGATLAGITAALGQKQKAMGIAVLKNAEYLQKDIEQWLENYTVEASFTLMHDYHFGGYAKTNDALTAFVNDFNEMQPFRIEPVYTGKLFYALHDLYVKNRIKKGTKVLAVHTGGMQYLVSRDVIAENRGQFFV